MTPLPNGWAVGWNPWSKNRQSARIRHCERSEAISSYRYFGDDGWRLLRRCAPRNDGLVYRPTGADASGRFAFVQFDRSMTWARMASASAGVSTLAKLTMPRSLSAPSRITDFHASALASVPETRRSGVKPLPIALSP